MAATSTARIIGVLLWLVVAWCARAETVSLVLADGTTATAGYYPGARERPAVLLVHGFLQTRYSTTIAGLTDSLRTAGYSVLAPTLSLGIDRRRRSLPCEAAHAHRMDGDLQEIGQWLDWLRDQGHRRAVLLGHSFGSLQVLAYLLDKPDPRVVKAIATSLVDLEHGVGDDDGQFQAGVARAHSLVAAHRKGLASFEISYCRAYVAPPAAFLSYATWSKSHILERLDELTVPMEVIMGSADARMDRRWPQLLAERGVVVTTIDGANHFFDGIYELELADNILRSLEQVNRSP